MEDCKPTSTPMAPNLVLSKSHCPSTPEEVQEMKLIPYRKAVGSLMYLSVATRPDITTAVGMCCRFMQSPGMHHWVHGVKHIFRYLSNCAALGLTYTRSSSQLVGWVDSSWADDADNGRSRAGFVFTWASCAICWMSRQMPTPALSSTEAEYMALTEAVKEALWLSALLSEMGFPLQGPLLIHEDNQGAIALAKNPVHHKRTKHVNVKYHFIRFYVELGSITIEYICTAEQLADHFTKNLPTASFRRFRVRYMNVYLNRKQINTQSGSEFSSDSIGVQFVHASLSPPPVSSPTVAAASSICCRPLRRQRHLAIRCSRRTVSGNRRRTDGNGQNQWPTGSHNSASHCVRQ